jgi:hypothetical protein
MASTQRGSTHVQCSEHELQQVGDQTHPPTLEPLLEYYATLKTGDPRYAWLDGIVAVAQGKVATQRVDYRVYQVR